MAPPVARVEGGTSRAQRLSSEPGGDLDAVHQGHAYPPPSQGYRPIGNWSALVNERNVAGDATAVLRRRLFDRHRYSEDLVSFEDWAFYRALHEDGLHGAVIPEALWDYRVRAQSMPREVGMRSEKRLLAEMDAIVRDEGMTWASKSA